ncbi:YcaO-like family protein [Strepomyces sp. STD 3.1]|uniref:YcaO-like family protein n=1 Tax=Streptomyces sp. NPDC058985 TaxID=3346684 RepID=UPI001F476FD6|nr:YcaO-like family protein [Streptomyces sp. STD 3.1]
MARFVALAEAAERYVGLDVRNEERITASARDLADECLEVERFPRCSDAEYAHPQCPVIPFEPEAAIRWTSGLDLISRQHVWVPAVSACYGLANPLPAELFTPRISTGFAVHTDPLEAVVRGVLEVIERDANAVLWLQQLPLPILDPAGLDHQVMQLVEWGRVRFMQVHLFDATSDLGVPTVYCLLCCPHDQRASRVVGAGSARDLATAAHKAILEAMSTPPLIHFTPESEDDRSPAGKRAAGDTARYLGRAEHSHAFDFLLHGPDRPAAPSRAPLPTDPLDALNVLISRLADAGMRPVAVDRTTTELADVGLSAVNVVIPDLQPMSLDPLAQFTAHPRLYDAPARMGYRALPLEELNPWPQPLG